MWKMAKSKEFTCICIYHRPYSFSFLFISGNHANHMTMTISGQIMPWPDYLKTNGNVNITLWDLCEILIVYILLSTFQSVHMVLTVNKPNVRRFIAWIESADWNPWVGDNNMLEGTLAPSDAGL